MVRRVGKSPPGGARRTRPVRARSGPISSTDPRRRPTSFGSGVSLVTVGVESRACGVPSPLTRAPTPVSRSAITRMSEMRGTFSRRHVSSLSRQAATSGSAEFLLPSTVMRPDSRRPPSMRSVDMVVYGADRRVSRTRRGRRSLRAGSRRSARRTPCWQRSTRARISRAVAAPSRTMKLPCRRRHLRPALAARP